MKAAARYRPSERLRAVHLTARWARKGRNDQGKPEICGFGLERSSTTQVRSAGPPLMWHSAVPPTLKLRGMVVVNTEPSSMFDFDNFNFDSPDELYRA